MSKELMELIEVIKTSVKEEVVNKSSQATLNRLLDEVVKEATTINVTGESLSDKATCNCEDISLSDNDNDLYKHARSLKEGNVRFKDSIDMELVIDMYKEGNGAGAIERAINSKVDTSVLELGFTGDSVYDRNLEVLKKDVKSKTVTRQTVINRLKSIGLWGNRSTWTVEGMTVEQKDYAKRHGIDILNIGGNSCE